MLIMSLMRPMRTSPSEMSAACVAVAGKAIAIANAKNQLLRFFIVLVSP